VERKISLITIFEDENLFCFLGNPIYNKDSDLLIIPKKHYEFIEELPKRLLLKINKKVVSIAGILRKKYSAVKILLNNGKNADQYIPHVHYHLIPKDKSRKNPWNNLSIKRFKQIFNELKKELNQKS